RACARPARKPQGVLAHGDGMAGNHRVERGNAAPRQCAFRPGGGGIAAHHRCRRAGAAPESGRHGQLRDRTAMNEANPAETPAAIEWDGVKRSYMPPETLRIDPSLRLFEACAGQVDP